MNIKSLKKFIKVFFVSILLLSFLIPYATETVYYVIAATVSGLEAKGAIKSNKVQETTTYQVLPKINGTAVAETTRKKSVGHAMDGAEFHDELWEKYSVIAAEDGGGLGKGGGANNKHSQVIGNKGEYDELGGVFGGEGGVYIGDAGFGSSGSATSDELRKMKAAIDASRAASISNEIANRLNQESVRESIEESERISASIQKKLRQEAVKAALNFKETYNVQETPHIQEAHNNFSSPTYNPDLEINKIVMPETFVAVPTAAPTVPRETERKLGAVINKDKLAKPADALAILKGQMAEYEDIQINAPTAAETMVSEIAPPEDLPVVPELPEQVFYDKPIVETAAVEPIIDKPEPVDEIESSLRESESMQAEEEKETTIAETENEDGASGGEDAEKDADKEGDADSKEKQGDSKDKGLLHFEKEEELKGKKIFEIETTGNIGLNKEFLSMLSTKTIMIFSLLSLFIVGSIIHFVRQRDKRSKKNYF